jgi:hypothetical protein
VFCDPVQSGCNAQLSNISSFPGTFLDCRIPMMLMAPARLRKADEPLFNIRLNVNHAREN